MEGVEEPIVIYPLTYEHLAPGLIRERSADQKLCIFVVHDGLAATIDAWETCARDVLNEWPTTRPCLLIHDFNRGWLGDFGKNMLGRFERLYTFRPDLKRQVAIILPHNVTISVLVELDIRLREMAAPYKYPIRWEVFAKRTEALKWLIYNRHREE